MNNLRVSNIITTDKIRTWSPGEVITIGAGTGVGKSFWVKNILYLVAKERKKKILYLIHRNDCIYQFREEIKRDNKSDTIVLKTYQSLESMYLNHKVIDLSEYQFIVCDEFHYFMSDAAFNITTDISLNLILGATNAIRIFMSATGGDMKRYLNDIKKLHTVDFQLPITFNFIESLLFFNKDETMDKFIEEAIEKNEKGIFFIQSAKKAYSLYKKYEKNCLFNCSKSNENYYKFVKQDKIHNMLKNERFEENILITTTSMDAGVNINDTDVRHIVCDIEDIGTLIQCIGRKRIKNDADKIYLYIHTINNQRLGGKKTQIKNKIEMADYLKTHTVKEFIYKYPRKKDYNNVIYDAEVNEDDKSTKKINELRHFKLTHDIIEIEIMLMYGDFGYCKYMANLFGFMDKDTGKFEYDLIKEDYLQDDLENYLKGMLGKEILQVKDRKELIEKIDVRSNGKLLKKINNLNGALEEREIPFRVIEFTTSKMIDGKQKRYPNAWKVEKLVS